MVEHDTQLPRQRGPAYTSAVGLAWIDGRPMNFLAHLLLAAEDDDAQLGAVLPDVVRGRLPGDLSPRVMASVDLHRRIDAFTDTHPAMGCSVARLRPELGRFAGIVMDVWYDHLLATQWDEHHAAPLPQFIDDAYDALRRGTRKLPGDIRCTADWIIAGDWLRQYRTRAGVGYVFERMSRRLTDRFRRPVDLTGAVGAIGPMHEAILDDFAAFFPDLCRHVRAHPASRPMNHPAPVPTA